jgi:hypothetical protein
MWNSRCQTGGHIGYRIVHNSPNQHHYCTPIKYEINRIDNPLYLCLKSYVWKSMVEWLGRSAQDQRIPSLSPGCAWSLLSPHVHQCSSTVWIAYDSCTLGSFEKSRGISPVLGFQFRPKSEGFGLWPELETRQFWITGPQWHTTALKCLMSECRNRLWCGSGRNPLRT